MIKSNVYQGKYALNILQAMMINAKYVTNNDSDYQTCTWPRRIILLSKQIQIVGKLNYLIVTCPNIAFVVCVISQFLNSFVKIIRMQS